MKPASFVPADLGKPDKSYSILMSLKRIRLSGSFMFPPYLDFEGITVRFRDALKLNTPLSYRDLRSLPWILSYGENRICSDKRLLKSALSLIEEGFNPRDILGVIYSCINMLSVETSGFEKMSGWIVKMLNEYSGVNRRLLRWKRRLCIFSGEGRSRIAEFMAGEDGNNIIKAFADLNLTFNSHIASLILEEVSKKIVIIAIDGNINALMNFLSFLESSGAVNQDDQVSAIPENIVKVCLECMIQNLPEHAEERIKTLIRIFSTKVFGDPRLDEKNKWSDFSQTSREKIIRWLNADQKPQDYPVSIQIRFMKNNLDRIIDILEDQIKDGKLIGEEICQSVRNLFDSLERSMSFLLFPGITVIIAGMASSGKSALVNSLSGHKILPYEKGETDSAVLTFIHNDDGPFMQVEKTQNSVWECHDFRKMESDGLFLTLAACIENDGFDGILKIYEWINRRKREDDNDAIIEPEMPRINIKLPFPSVIWRNILGMPEALRLEIISLPGLMNEDDVKYHEILSDYVKNAENAFYIIALDQNYSQEAFPEKLLVKLGEWLEKDVITRKDSFIFVSNHSGKVTNVLSKIRILRWQGKLQEHLKMKEPPEICPMDLQMFHREIIEEAGFLTDEKSEGVLFLEKLRKKLNAGFKNQFQKLVIEPFVREYKRVLDEFLIVLLNNIENIGRKRKKSRNVEVLNRMDQKFREINGYIEKINSFLSEH